MISPLCSVVRGGVEPPPATYQIAMLPLQHRTVGKAGVESAVSCSQGTRGTVPLPPDHSSLRWSDPCGIRTQPLQLERLTTSPEVERAVLLCARTLSAVGREALESSSAAFQATAKPSQLPTHSFVACVPATDQQKKPDVLATPGFCQPSDRSTAKRHKRIGCGRVFCRDRLSLPAE